FSLVEHGEDGGDLEWVRGVAVLGGGGSLAVGAAGGRRRPLGRGGWGGGGGASRGCGAGAGGGAGLRGGKGGEHQGFEVERAGEGASVGPLGAQLGGTQGVADAQELGRGGVAHPLDGLDGAGLVDVDDEDARGFGGDAGSERAERGFDDGDAALA